MRRCLGGVGQRAGSALAPADAQQVWAWRPRGPGPRAGRRAAGPGAVQGQVWASQLTMLPAVGDLGARSQGSVYSLTSGESRPSLTGLM